MQAINEAKVMFQKLNLNFEEQLAWYLQNGLVVSRADRFIMAKAINSARGDDDWNPKDADTWYVNCAIGKGCLEWFILQAPYRLPKIAWRRIKDPKNRLKYYDTNKFERLCA